MMIFPFGPSYIQSMSASLNLRIEIGLVLGRISVEVVLGERLVGLRVVG